MSYIPRWALSNYTGYVGVSAKPCEGIEAWWDSSLFARSKSCNILSCPEMTWKVQAMVWMNPLPMIDKYRSLSMKINLKWGKASWCGMVVVHLSCFNGDWRGHLALRYEVGKFQKCQWSQTVNASIAGLCFVRFWALLGLGILIAIF